MLVVKHMFIYLHCDVRLQSNSGFVLWSGNLFKSRFVIVCWVCSFSVDLRCLMPVLNKKKQDFKSNNPFLRAVLGCASRGIKSCRAKLAATRGESRMRRAAVME